MSAAGYALLWDFDGTLVDSGELWRRSEYTFLNARKLPWNDAASKRLLGGNLELAAHVMAEVTGVRFTVDELRRGLVTPCATRCRGMCRGCPACAACCASSISAACARPW